MRLDLSTYKQISRARMISSLIIAEYGAVTEKLTDPKNRGAGNPVWQTGCSISAGANRPETILEMVPYVIRMGDDSSDLISELTKSAELDSRTGGKRIDIRLDSAHALMAALIIPVQFAILEAFETDSFRNRLENGGILRLDSERFSLNEIEVKGFDRIRNGRIEAKLLEYQRQPTFKRIKTWDKIGVAPLDEGLIQDYQALAERRNTLVHDVFFEEPSIKEAIDYYKRCETVANAIDASLGAQIEQKTYLLTGKVER